MMLAHSETITSAVQSPTTRQFIQKITAEFLSNLSGMPIHKAEAALGRERGKLTDLICLDILWSGDGRYLPGFCALYFMSPEISSEFERHVHSFLEFAKDLYGETGTGPYNFVDICREFGQFGEMGIRDASLQIGAHLARSFSKYFFSFVGVPRVDISSVVSESSGGFPSMQFGLAPEILDYTDLESSWVKYLSPSYTHLSPAASPSLVGEKTVTVPKDTACDVFICHASEDKDYCESLVNTLSQRGIRVWFDKIILKWGDELRREIDDGLRSCKYGIVVLSKSFLAGKKWTEHELSSLFARETLGKKVILPIWHGITREDLLKYSPFLADRLAKVTSTDDCDNIADAMAELLGKPLAKESNAPLVDEIVLSSQLGDLLTETEGEQLEIEDEYGSDPYRFLRGRRNAWVGLMEECWPKVGAQLNAISDNPTSTLDDLRRALRPIREHPNNSSLASYFYCDSTQQATPAQVQNTGRELDALDEEIRGATSQLVELQRLCSEAERALLGPLDSVSQATIELEAADCKDRRNQTELSLRNLRNTQEMLNAQFLDQKAYVFCGEFLDFLHSAEHKVIPMNIGNALAGLPDMGWRESFALCSAIVFEAPRWEYQVFEVISRICKHHIANGDTSLPEVFRRELLASGAQGHTVRFLRDNWRDLRLAIEEDSNSNPDREPNPFNIVSILLEKVMGPKSDAERVLGRRERL